MSIHPDDRDRVVAGWDQAIKTNTPWKSQHRFVHEDGTIVWVVGEMAVNRKPDGEVQGYVGALFDITKQKEVEENLKKQTSYIKLLQLVAITANESSDIDEALRYALVHICNYTGWCVGHVYMPIEDKLVTTDIWHFLIEGSFEVFKKVTGVTNFLPGIGLPGRVYSSKRPAWIVDVTKDPNFPRAVIAPGIEARAGFGFPVLSGSEVVAILEFFHDKPVEPDEPLLEIMGQVGTQLGRAIERTRMEESLRKLNEELIDKLEQVTSQLANATRGFPELRAKVRQIMNEVISSAREG